MPYFLILLVVASIAGFIRHLFWVVGYALANLDQISVGEAIMMIGGTFVPPLGVIHGFVLWFT
jgi:hypothetical protein